MLLPPEVLPPLRKLQRTRNAVNLCHIHHRDVPDRQVKRLMHGLDDAFW